MLPKRGHGLVFIVEVSSRWSGEHDRCGNDPKLLGDEDEF
jgi:hypothetical protein